MYQLLDFSYLPLAELRQPPPLTMLLLSSERISANLLAYGQFCHEYAEWFSVPVRDKVQHHLLHKSKRTSAVPKTSLANQSDRDHA